MSLIQNFCTGQGAGSGMEVPGDWPGSWPDPETSGQQGSSLVLPQAIPGASHAEKPMAGTQLLMVSSSQRKEPGMVFREAWVWKEAGRMHVLPGSGLALLVRLPQAQNDRGHEGQVREVRAPQGPRILGRGLDFGL